MIDTTKRRTILRFFIDNIIISVSLLNLVMSRETEGIYAVLHFGGDYSIQTFHEIITVVWKDTILLFYKETWARTVCNIFYYQLLAKFMAYINHVVLNVGFINKDLLNLNVVSDFVEEKII